MRLTGRTITDDRGVKHPVTRWVYSSIYPFPWQDVYRQTPKLWRWWQKSAFVLVALLLVSYVMMNFVFPSSGTARLPNTVWPWIPTAMVAWIVIFMVIHFRVFKPWLKQYELAIGRCRACNYNLENLTPDPDGCTTCPECGAAWKLPPTLPDA